MGADWFRNTTWNDTIERTFDEKLGRARKRDQYLRIQACTLAHSHPEVALRLLDRYFALNDDFDHAQAHVDRATALLSLGRVDEALAAYEAALARESAFPNLRRRRTSICRTSSPPAVFERDTSGHWNCSIFTSGA